MVSGRMRVLLPSLLLFLGVTAGEAADRWYRAAPNTQSVAPRRGHGMVYDDRRGRVVLFGGGSADGDLNDTWELDGTGWSTGPTAPGGLGPRQFHSMAFDETRGVTVMFGGYDGPSFPRGDTWEYDGSRWSEYSGAGPTARVRTAMVYDSGRDVVVLFGGTTISSLKKDVWEYDGTVWTRRATPPQGLKRRLGHAMSYDRKRGLVVLFGGLVEQGYLLVPTDDTWEYDGSTWTEGPVAPTGLAARSSHAMAFDPAIGETVMVGGRTTYRDLKDAWKYDGARWRRGPALPAEFNERGDHAMAWDESRQALVLFGGLEAFGPHFDDVWELRSGTWTQRVLPTGLSPRRDHAMAYDSDRGKVVLFGGDDGALTPETWEYDEDGWKSGGSAPPGLVGREGSAMTFDSARSRVVLVGGWLHTTTGFLDDTWYYDGQWTPGPAAPAGLDGRYGHGLAFDTRREVSVMFGGSTGSGLQRDTWELDGVAWRLGPAAPAGLAGRLDAGLAFDPDRGVTVLFGGYGSARNLNDTWEYDGNTWTAGPPAPLGLGPRYGLELAYDEAMGRMVLFGGYVEDTYPGTAANDTWYYRSGAWQAGASPGLGMEERLNPGLVYDSQRERLVLFGGEVVRSTQSYWGWGMVGDTWELDGRRGTVDILTGPGAGLPNPNRVRVHDSDGNPSPVDFIAYGSAAWGTNVAAADLRWEAEEQIVTGPGPGEMYGPHVKTFAADGSPLGGGFYAYGTLRYGVDVAAGGVDPDPPAEILTGAGPGEIFGPQVRGWKDRGSGVTPLTDLNYFAYASLRFGVRVHVGDVDGDGAGEILTTPGPGPSLGPHVRGWDFGVGPLRPAPLSFFAFAVPRFGARAGSGDVDGDGFDELLVGPGPGPGLPARLRGFDYDGNDVVALSGFDEVIGTTMYGVAGTAGDLDGDGCAEALAGAGPDPAASSRVLSYTYDGSALSPFATEFEAFAGLGFGVEVESGALGF